MRIRLVLAAAAFAALAGTSSHAAAFEPFPNQPGALSEAQIQAATDAMRPMLRGEPELPLAASGRRSEGHVMPSYVLFASAASDFSERVKVRRQIICNYFRPASRWECSTPHDHFRMTANGIEHAFSHQIVKGPGDRQGAVGAVDYVYSQCFRAQFAALGGKPLSPVPDADFVSAVVDDGEGFDVLTGPLAGKDAYRLEKTDKAKDNCGFRIVHARSGGVALPESYAKEMARQGEESRRQAAEAKKAAEEAKAAELARWAQRRERAEMWMKVGFISGLAALVLPWVGLLFGRKIGLAVAGVLALTVSTAFFGTVQDPIGGNIRIDLIIMPALALTAWAIFIGLAIATDRGLPRASFPIAWAVLGPLASAMLALLLIFGLPLFLVIAL